jgi:hypothetical protein
LATVIEDYFELRPAKEHQWLVPRDTARALDLADFVHAKHAWTPIDMRILDVNDVGRPREYADLPWVSSAVLAVRERARTSLSDLLPRSGTWLPIAAPPDVWIFVPPLSASLNEQNASVDKLQTGRIALVHEYAFEAPEPTDALFRIRQMPEGPIIATRAFVDALATFRLTGLDPKPIQMR